MAIRRDYRGEGLERGGIERIESERENRNERGKEIGQREGRRE